MCPPIKKRRITTTSAVPTKVSVNPPTDAQARDLANRLPFLAGQPIPTPVFLNQFWEEGQIFTAADDFDRVKEPWQAPEFIEFASPMKRSQTTQVENLSLPPKVDKDKDATSNSFACLVKNVFTEDECRQVLEKFNAKTFRPCLLNKGGGNQMLDPTKRDTFRAMVDSPDFATWVFNAIRQHLPERLEDGATLVGLNSFLRCLCYLPGQQFESHIDNSMKVPDGSFSRVTVMIYLNTVPEACGGATTFCPVCTHWPCWHEHGHGCIRCQPLAGSVLLFSQDLRHEGTLLEDGIKYAIRTEAMYKHPSTQS